MNVDVVDIDHVAIEVSDLDNALAFYHDLLGMELRDEDRFAEGRVPFVAVVAGGRHIHLVPTDEPSETGSEHLCLLVRSTDIETRAELEAFLDSVEAAGYQVERDEPKKRYGAYGRDWAAYVRDPDGRRVELKFH